MTQEERVLDYLRTFGTITAKEAFDELGIAQLPARILRLRRRGHSISMEQVDGKNRFGEHARYGVYTLHEPELLTERQQAISAAGARIMSERNPRTYDEYKELRYEYEQLELMALEGSRW